MITVAAVPSVALVAGAALGIALLPDPARIVWLVPLATLMALAAHRRDAGRVLLGAMSVACGAAGMALGSDAAREALDTPLRALLDREAGGFALATMGPEGPHDPWPVRAVLTEDAALRGDHVSLRAEVVALAVRGTWRDAPGGVALSVSGSPLPDDLASWRAGRTIEAPVTFRRPARYLNHGVPDHERQLALDGTTLLGSIKSGLLIDVTGTGTLVQETAARLRAAIRRGADRSIAPHDPLSRAIVVAILIGDRSGLPSEVRERLQAAGTYHVIAISGGNIAILAGVVTGLLLLIGLQGRPAALIAVLVLVLYAHIVTAEPSVWRATLMGVLYFAARTLDHRTSPWHAIAVAAALMTSVRPLDVRSPGFLLSFGATVALLEGARRGRSLLPRHRALAWVAASITASLATEAALLPVAAHAFSRITAAGLVLNLAAVPLMTVIQLAGMAAVLLQPLDWVAGPAGWIAHAAATLLVESARLVELAPWLSWRVPPPHAATMTAYYAALALALGARGRLRMFGAGGLLATLLVIAGVVPPAPPPSDARLRLTVFDVGQAEAILVEPPRGRPFLVDAAGVPFGGGSFDIGGRVLAPALWTRGVRSLAALLVTHGHPDHTGGAPAMLRDFRPRAFWHGVAVGSDTAAAASMALASRRGAHVAQVLARAHWVMGGVIVRVLHPPPPDWERRDVRNDDSVVLELVFRDVAFLLTGDIGAEVERSLLPRLTPAPRRVLKVAHHGSRTSSSQALLDYWRPEIAVISAGRGNSFGHPAAEVVRRLEEAGATMFRTDQHGQITIETDGRTLAVRTFVTGEATKRAVP